MCVCPFSKQQPGVNYSVVRGHLKLNGGGPVSPAQCAKEKKYVKYNRKILKNHAGVQKQADKVGGEQRAGVGDVAY